MRYRIVGINTKSIAKMSVELEASSESDARAQARARGISVHSVSPVRDGGTSSYDNSGTRILPPLPGQDF